MVELSKIIDVGQYPINVPDTIEYGDMLRNLRSTYLRYIQGVPEVLRTSKGHIFLVTLLKGTNPTIPKLNNRRFGILFGLFCCFRDGIVILPGFLTKETIDVTVQEISKAKGQEWMTDSTHNVFLDKGDPAFPEQHIR